MLVKILWNNSKACLTALLKYDTLTLSVKKEKGKIMEFILIWDWVDEETGYLYDQQVDFFATKEQLFEAKKAAEKTFPWQVAIGRLILSPAIGYSWAEVDRLF